MDVSGTVNWESLKNEKFDTHEIRDETMLNSFFFSSLFSVLFLNKLGGGRVGGGGEGNIFLGLRIEDLQFSSSPGS